MRRSYIKRGDKTTNGGVVLDGLERCLHHGTELSYLEAKVYCPRCKGVGTIAPHGPRRPGTLMGRRAALEGDLCLCRCDPPPQLVASQWDMFQSFEGAGVERAGDGFAGAAAAAFAAAMSPAMGGAGEAGEEDEVPLPASSARTEAKPDCSYLDGTRSRIDAPKAYYRHVNKVTVAPAKQTQFKFQGMDSPSPATESDVTVNGHVIPVYSTTRAAPAGTAVATPAQLTKALEVLPEQHLVNINRIIANPVPNPWDAYWQKERNDPTFYSGAAANLEQGVAFYPWRNTTSISQEFIDSTMLHETGHQMSQALWARDPQLRDEWTKAVAGDPGVPSVYAKADLGEDFAETANMYWSSKGTPCEEEGKRRYPNRYKYFDQITR